MKYLLKLTLKLLAFSLCVSLQANAQDRPFKPEVCYPPTEKHYPGLKPPITDTAGAECASNTTEMRAMFPNVSASINRLEGTWTDGNFRKLSRPLPKEKRYKDKDGNLIVNDIDFTRINYSFNANKTGMWIQEQSDDKKNVATYSTVMPVQICKKDDRMFLKTASAEIPIAFPSKRCMWIGSQGKWWRFWKFSDVHYGFAKPTDDIFEAEPVAPAKISKPAAKTTGTQ